LLIYNTLASEKKTSSFFFVHGLQRRRRYDVNETETGYLDTVEETTLFKNDRGGVVGLMLIVASSLRPTREPAIASGF